MNRHFHWIPSSIYCFYSYTYPEREKEANGLDHGEDQRVFKQQDEIVRDCSPGTRVHQTKALRGSFSGRISRHRLFAPADVSAFHKRGCFSRRLPIGCHLECDHHHGNHYFTGVSDHPSMHRKRTVSFRLLIVRRSVADENPCRNCSK